MHKIIPKYLKRANWHMLTLTLADYMIMARR